ncbi:MAG: terminase large subunit domain-containing protein [bacterium]
MSLPSQTKEITWPYIPQPGKQTEFDKAFHPKLPYDMIGYGGARGGGKAAPYNSLVATPFGFRRMGDLKIGDTICDTERGNQKVIAVHEQGEQDIYKVTLSTGATTFCTLDHLWKCTISGKGYKKAGVRASRYKIFTTKMLIDQLNKDHKTNRYPLIPLPDPVQFTRSYKKDMIGIDPYILGLLLGDGTFRHNAYDIITTADEEIVRTVLSGLSDGSVSVKEKSNHFEVRILKGVLRNDLEKLGLTGTSSDNKFIPEAYKHLPIEKRFSLAQGMMDTGGYVDSRGHLSYTTVSKYLAEDFQWVVRSLGAKATIWKGKSSYKDKYGRNVSCKDAYTVTFNAKNNSQFVRLNRKKDRCVDIYNGGAGEGELKHRMISIDFSHREKARCITVSNPNQLYITDDFIVTHNSYMLRGILFKLCCWKPMHVVIVRKTIAMLDTNHIEPMKTEIKDFVDNGLITYDGRNRSFNFSNGSVLSFRYCRRDSDLDGWQGQGFDIIGFEEATHFSKHQLNFMGTANRTSPVAEKYGTEYRPRMAFTFNWGGPGHREMKRIFWDGFIMGDKSAYAPEEDPNRVIFFFAKVTDNPLLIKKSPQYVRKLASLKGAMFRAHAIGDPYAFAGAMFQMFERAHIVEPFKVPKEWPVYGAMDRGTSAPCSFGIYTRSPTGMVYKVAHYYEKNRKVTQHAEAIARFIENCEWISTPPSFIVAGHDCFSRQSRFEILSHEFTWADVFRDHGLHLVPGVRDRVQRAQAMMDYLDFEYDYSKDKLVREPKLQFFKGQEITLERLQALEPDENEPERVAQSDNIEDHDYDETSFMIASAIKYNAPKDEPKPDLDANEDWGRAEDEAFFEGEHEIEDPEDWTNFM